jgi:hypothetical protein
VIVSEKTAEVRELLDGHRETGLVSGPTTGGCTPVKITHARRPRRAGRSVTTAAALAAMLFLVAAGLASPALYPTHAAFVRAWTADVARLTARGYLTPVHASNLIAASAVSTVS